MNNMSWIWKKINGYWKYIVGLFIISTALAAPTLLIPEETRFNVSLGNEMVKIGGEIEGKFRPEAKLSKWNNEVFIKVKQPTTKNIKAVNENGKIKWIDTDKEVHMYTLPPDEQNEGGIFEFEVVLKKKPTTNVITLEIETQGLDFFYQAPLTQIEKIGVEGVARITETHTYDKDDNIITYRPENIVGSYAVYHSTKKGDYTSLGGENYKNGMAFQIYRPRIEDSNGWNVWGELNINEQLGELTVTIPQDFINNAVYPIKHAAGLTFGNTTSGGTSKNCGGFGPYASEFTSGVSSGTASKMTAWVREGAGASDIAGAIYTDGGSDPANVITNGITDTVNENNSSAHWTDFPFSTEPSISASTVYWLAINCSTSGTDFYYSDTTTLYSYDTTAGVSFPDPWSATGNGSRQFDVYVTYTASAPATADVIQPPQLPILWIN